MQPLTRLVLASAVAAATAPAAHPAAARADLPRVDIEVARSIGDDRKTPASMRIAGPRGYRGRIGIELRGGASRRFAKKSYALETRRRGAKARNVALLGMPAENDWILNAVHSDRTLSRDALAYATARRLGRWAPRTRFVELRLNRRYRGVYLLTEQLKLDRARVAVPRSGISGGYLVELSSAPFPRGFPSLFAGRFYGHEDPKPRQLKSAEAAWIASYVAAAERAVAARDGSWRTLVAEAAAVDYLLLQELFKNYDAFHRSTFLAKGSDLPLAFGPIWDFDRSMGLDLTGGIAAASGWITPGRPWAADLLADSAFSDRLVARWRGLRAGDMLGSMLRELDHTRRALRTAQLRNARRWPATRAPSHASEMRRLRTWLTDRVAWIDANIAGLGAAARAGGG
ncbi:MAG TPA: CotH kinase family protein [Solirubrobacteraceae bacterium]|nr:CotH kinase family protein [Solirubrobacteraceae bacterium]